MVDARGRLPLLPYTWQWGWRSITNTTLSNCTCIMEWPYTRNFSRGLQEVRITPRDKYNPILHVYKQCALIYCVQVLKMMAFSEITREKELQRKCVVHLVFAYYPRFPAWKSKAQHLRRPHLKRLLPPMRKVLLRLVFLRFPLLLGVLS